MIEIIKQRKNYTDYNIEDNLDVRIWDTGTSFCHVSFGDENVVTIKKSHKEKMLKYLEKQIIEENKPYRANS